MLSYLAGGSPVSYHSSRSSGSSPVQVQGLSEPSERNAERKGGATPTPYCACRFTSSVVPKTSRRRIT
jgi:hypothetical protein